MKIRILYSENFKRKLKKLEESLQEEVFLAVEKFEIVENHKNLKVHKLRGKFKDYYSFSVNYSHRIIFEYVDEKTIAFLLTVGNHDIYDQFLK